MYQNINQFTIFMYARLMTIFSQNMLSFFLFNQTGNITHTTCRVNLWNLQRKFMEMITQDFDFVQAKVDPKCMIIFEMQSTPQLYYSV